MKKRLFLFGLCLMVLFLGSCLSTKEATNSSKETNVAVSNTEGEEFVPPAAGAEVQVGQEIFSDVDGIIIEQYDPLPSFSPDVVVVETSSEYFYKGKVCVSDYQLVYGNVLSQKTGEVKQKDSIGVATEELIGVFCRSKTLDAYLVSVSSVIPEFYQGYWYYFPGMFISSEMKWLDYFPPNEENFKDMYAHAKESPMSLIRFYWPILLKTQLTEMPTLLEDGTASQIIKYQDMPLSLRWQNGFYSYLENEYTLGDDIYLYLQIGGMAYFKNAPVFDCYVRDFSLVPPEEVVEERIKIILEE